MDPMMKLSLTLGVFGGLGAACKAMPKLGLIVAPAVILWALW